MAMNYLVDAKEGSRFRWTRDGTVCRITKIRDSGLEVHFVYESGPKKGDWGYAILPQEVELVTVLDELADI